jgi:hypothetical protein
MTVKAPQLLTQSLENSLNALARGLRVVRDGPPVVQPGQPVTDSLLPIAAELGVTNVANPLVGLIGTLTGNITGSLGNLVANLSPDLDPGPITGSIDGALGTLTPNLEPGNIGGSITGTLGDLAADLTGNLAPDPDNGGLASLVPIPFRLPVKVEVTWSVHEDVKVQRPHSPVPSVQRVPVDTDSFVAADGLTSPVASFAFLPEVTELTAARPPVSARFIRANVELTVVPSLVPALSDAIGTEPITVGPIALPDVPVLIPALAVPRVLALFRHDTFEPFQEDDGFVLIVVPSGSPLRSLGQLDAVLGELDSMLSKLSALRTPGLSLVPVPPPVDTALNHFAAMLLGVRKLVGALRQPHVRFRVANSIGDLVAIHMIKRSFAGVDPFARDVRAGDETSSLIFIGSPGEKVRFWNNRDFLNQQGNRRGQLLITAGPQMAVAIPNLHSALPQTEPPGRAQAIIDPDDPETFGDALRSLKFESPS